MVIIDPDDHLLRLSCGSCGDTIDIHFEITEEKEIIASFSTAFDVHNDKEEIKENLLTPVHLLL
jgi:hypothetical protein